MTGMIRFAMHCLDKGNECFVGLRTRADGQRYPFKVDTMPATCHHANKLHVPRLQAASELIYTIQEDDSDTGSVQRISKGPGGTW